MVFCSSSNELYRISSKLGDDDKMRVSMRNIARSRFFTKTSDRLPRDTPKGCGNCIPTIMGGQDDPAVWKCGSANEEVQRLAVQSGEVLEFNHIYLPFSIFAPGGFSAV
jgi:hypothetical protein